MYMPNYRRLAGRQGGRGINREAHFKDFEVGAGHFGAVEVCSVGVGCTESVGGGERGEVR